MSNTLIIFVSPRDAKQSNPVIKLVLNVHDFVKQRIDWMNENVDPTKWVPIWGNLEDFKYEGKVYKRVYYIGLAFLNEDDMTLFKLACG